MEYDSMRTLVVHFYFPLNVHLYFIIYRYIYMNGKNRGISTILKAWLISTKLHFHERYLDVKVVLIIVAV